MNLSRSTAHRLAIVLGGILLLLLVSGYAAAQETPPKIPHPLEGRDACLACHEAGLAGAPQIPADHAGRTNDMCRACHQPLAAAVEAPTKAPSTSDDDDTPVAAPSAALAATPAAQAPEMPHSLAGHENCLECHASAGATPVPTAGTPEPTGTPSAPVGGPPHIPHPTEGRQDCLACHRDGVGGAPVVSQR